ncbi:MAG: MCE family protein, partial [Actinomycetales bacterium]
MTNGTQDPQKTARKSLRHQLSTSWERVKTEPGLKKNVGALTILVVLAVGAGGWILSNQSFTPPWSDDITLKAEFEAAPGIAPGNGQEVRVPGVMVGSITGADVNKDGRAEITMRVEKDTEIYDNATLVLRPKSPLNEMYVTIAPGDSSARRVTSGHTFATASTRRPVQVDEVLGSLDDDARSALTSLLSEAD